MSFKFREELNAISPFVPARSKKSIQKEFGVDDVLKLAGNECRLGSSELAKKAAIEALNQAALYPDVDCVVLREKLSEKIGVSVDQIIVDNGLFALIALLGKAFLDADSEVIIPAPTFDWYKIVTLSMGAKPIFVPLVNHTISLRDVHQQINEKTRLIWLCNPNNPTGTFFPINELQDFLKTVPQDVIVVLDEAYREFVDDAKYVETVPLLKLHSNLIILRTFSKVYGLAGLRVGYGAMHPEIIKQLLKLRDPVGVNIVAQAAAVASLEDTLFINRVIDNNKKEKLRLYARFSEWGVEYIPTQTNFILFNIGIDVDVALKEFLKSGILLRGGKDFGLPTWIRATIGTEQDNSAVLDVIEHIVKHYKSEILA